MDGSGAVGLLRNEMKETKGNNAVDIGQGIRQGDVLLRRVGNIPKRATRRKAESEIRIVVEYGEATGHAHTLDPSAVEAYDILTEAGAIVGQAFRVIEETPLLHQEHGVITLQPGIFERWYQFEDDGESERQVAD